jgi:hypothetical protein
MDLAKRDILVKDLENTIKNKKLFLENKKEELSKNIEENSYLKDVIDEYDTYFYDINRETKEQYNALQNILDYINRITLETDLDSEDMSKHDINMILSEMKKLKFY